jgi:NAD(P)-dependent dehydrogenase (short-subunit alcohol dehydrogenase family)
MYTVPDQTGKRFVITGASSGTGKEAARRIAAAGGAVIMAVRTPSKGEAAKAEILRDHPATAIEVRQLDLADLSGVRAFAESLLADGTPIDVLVNSAGVLMPPPTRMLTADGFELQFGTNFLGPFALTVLLLPRILESATPRVTTKSSLMAKFGRIRFDDLESSKRYVWRAAYSQSKLAGMLMGMRLAELAAGVGIPLISTIAHTGFTRADLQTAGGNLGRDASRPRQPRNRTLIPPMDVTQGAEALIFAAADPAAEQGAYYGPAGFAGLAGPIKRVRLPRSARRDAALPASLWTVAERLTDAKLAL